MVVAAVVVVVVLVVVFVVVVVVVVVVMVVVGGGGDVLILNHFTFKNRSRDFFTNQFQSYRTMLYFARHVSHVIIISVFSVLMHPESFTHPV